MLTNKRRHAVTCHSNILMVPVALAAALAAGGIAAASPIQDGRVGGADPAANASSLFLASDNASMPRSLTEKAAGLSSAVGETLHAMAVGTLYNEPSFRVLGAAPLSSAPSGVVEPATMGLLAAGCLTILALSRRLRPAHPDV